MPHKNPAYASIPDLDIYQGPYWVKLGEKNKYAQDAIDNGRIYVRWNEVIKEYLDSNNWSKIEQVIRKASEKEEKENKGAATIQYRLFATFCASTADDIWITFHNTKMYWGKLKEDSPIIFGRINGEEVKYRELDENGWRSVSKNGKSLEANQMPGQIALMAGTHQTLGRVNTEDDQDRSEILLALINDDKTKIKKGLEEALYQTKEFVVLAIKRLHPNDFEILIDLIYRQAGWKRQTVLGQIMKDVDMELEEPFLKCLKSNNNKRQKTRYKYVVQVKSRASLKEYEKFCEMCYHLKNDDEADSAFSKGFFFVHSNYDKIQLAANENPEYVELVLPEQIADMVIEFGLVNWLYERTA